MYLCCLYEPPKLTAAARMNHSNLGLITWCKEDSQVALDNWYYLRAWIWRQLDVVVFNGRRYSHTQSNNQLMTLITELPINLLLPLTTIQQQTQNIIPTRIYCQLKYTANDNKLPTTVSMSEENFSLEERIKSVPVHFEDKMYQYILSKNWHPPTLPLKRKFDATNPWDSSVGTQTEPWEELWWKCHPAAQQSQSSSTWSSTF